MLSTLKVPGVYVQEVSTLPPSVAPVATAIPAFLGYTERSGPNGGKDLTAVPTRIKSLLEYETVFGGPPAIKYTQVTLDATGALKKLEATYDYCLYESLRLFYANGGGPCYILSVGTYKTDRTVAKTDFLPDSGSTDPKPLVELGKIDEITLVLAPDAHRLGDDLKDIHQALLAHCGDRMDRFAVLDPPLNDDGEVDLTKLRDGSGQQHLSYGAAYAPFLRVVPPVSVGYLSPTIPVTDGQGANLRAHADALISATAGVDNPFADYNKVTTAQDTYAADLTDATAQAALVTAIDEFATKIGIDLAATDITGAAADLKAYRDIVAATPADEEAIKKVQARVHATLPALRNYENALRQSVPAYGALVRSLETYAFAIPPSGAVAGAMARTDRNRGVWKAPANLSLNGVLGPTERFTSSELGEMNVHPATGKSVNAIRAFVGKGTLVFGARTLAGNDGEYKYVPVRRLMIFLEESIQKACEAYVFEANDANTWTRLRGMIENFLNLQWRAGALQGATAEEAYRVEVALGTTMTADDLLAGRMIVVVSVAPVRPAEFIVLRFTQHQLN